MKAVVNATPLICLALLDRLSLLNEMFDCFPTSGFQPGYTTMDKGEGQASGP